MTTKTNTNGQVRKSLAEQIDRLDMMLDGLSEGLNDAVAQAVKDAVGAAVQQAVQAVLREVLTSPELLARLCAVAPVAMPPAPTPEAPKAAWKQRWGTTCKGLTAWLAAARAACAHRLDQTRRWAIGALQHLRLLGQFKYQLLTAFAVGAAAGVAIYFAGPWLAAAAGGVGAFAATLAVQVGIALKRLLVPIADRLG